LVDALVETWETKLVVVKVASWVASSVASLAAKLAVCLVVKRVALMAALKVFAWAGA